MQSWHLIGVIGVVLNFPFLFAPAIGLTINEEECKDNPECNDMKMVTIYYSVFSAFNNIAWAFVQISHLAMIPEITSSEYYRGSLTTIRNIGTVVSSIFVYAILWILLGTGTVICSRMQQHVFSPYI